MAQQALSICKQYRNKLLFNQNSFLHVSEFDIPKNHVTKSG